MAQTTKLDKIKNLYSEVQISDVALSEQELPTSAACGRAPRWKLFHERVGLSIDGLPVRPIIRDVAIHTQERKPMGVYDLV